MSREPMTYAERLHRLTLAMVVEKLEAMAAEGRTITPRAEHKHQQGPPARGSRP